jgi:hypothetical protein
MVSALFSNFLHENVNQKNQKFSKNVFLVKICCQKLHQKTNCIKNYKHQKIVGKNATKNAKTH